MRHVRPVRLLTTAAFAAAAVGVSLTSRPIPVAAPTASVPAPVDALVTTADPALPTTPLAGVAVDRVVRPVADVDPDLIPSAALQAYQRAATIAAKVDGDCGITWSLLAAIGGIESDHGRQGGATLGDDGVSTPLIRGVALDGHGRVAKVADTDAGKVDGLRRWDRAVGPMQFLPATWATVGVDADGDGERSADDLDDAALGAAVYLCAVPGDLTDRAGLRAALFRYNPSQQYVADVIALEQEYRTGAYDVPKATGISPVVVRAARQPHTLDSPTQPAPPAQPAPPDKHQHHETGAVRDDEETGGGKGNGPHPTPDQEPHPIPTPDPEPPVDPDPEVAELTGVLSACGTDEEPAWCLDETVLDVGDEDYLAAEALADFDGDEVVETNAEELAGLADTEVTLAVLTNEDAAPVVLQVGGLDYRVEESAEDSPADGAPAAD